MSNSMTDDYFAFMSDKSTSKLSPPGPVKFAPPKKVEMQVDTVDFVDDTQMEVTESSISDTMIQRIFRPQKA